MERYDDGNARAIAALIVVFIFLLAGMFLLIYLPLHRDLSGSNRVAIDATTFPDAALRAYVTANLDLNGDGYLSDAEADAVREIGSYDTATGVVTNPGISGCGVTSLQGIENFPHLQTLVAEDDQIATIDLNGNPELVRLDLRGNPSFELSYPATGDKPQVLVDPGVTYDAVSLLDVERA